MLRTVRPHSKQSILASEQVQGEGHRRCTFSRNPSTPSRIRHRRADARDYPPRLTSSRYRPSDDRPCARDAGRPAAGGSCSPGAPRRSSSPYRFPSPGSRHRASKTLRVYMLSFNDYRLTSGFLWSIFHAFPGGCTSNGACGTELTWCRPAGGAPVHGIPARSMSP
jgi:hypothetical protein